MKAYMKTHRGLVREQNEDTICVAEPLYVLARLPAPWRRARCARRCGICSPPPMR